MSVPDPQAASPFAALAARPLFTLGDGRGFTWGDAVLAMLLRGDWDALRQVMDPGVEWLWYERGDWDCHDRRKVLATLFERQREGVVTGLNAVVAVDERVFVEVTGPRLEQWVRPGGQACMVITVRDGRIVRMQDYPSRAAALAGAGLPPEPQTATEAEGEPTGDPPRLRPDAPSDEGVISRVVGDFASHRRP